MLAVICGVIGFFAILLLAYAISRNRAAIDWHTVINGLLLQLVLAVLVLKIPAGRIAFEIIGMAVEQILSFSDAGARFVFGSLMPNNEFNFALKLVPTIIFVAALSSVAYHWGILQKVVAAAARFFGRFLKVSGAEMLSNTSSVFVGQVEAQLLVKPYVATMTQSELLTVMAGSMACIAGGVMAVYIQMGVPAAYLITASLMAIPGAVAIAKIIVPETDIPVTRGKQAEMSVENPSVNVIDALAHGAIDGLKIGVSVCALLIAFLALIAMLDYVINNLGMMLAHMGVDATGAGIDLEKLSLRMILGWLFSGVALLLGVPWMDVQPVGSLLGTKLLLNEFVAYSDLAPMIKEGLLAPRSVVVASFALCGFANFGSVAMLVGGIGAMAPTRRSDLARLGLLAMLVGTMASYLSSILAGLMTPYRASSPLLGWLVPLLLLAVLLVARYLLLGRAKGDTMAAAAAIADESRT